MRKVQGFYITILFTVLPSLLGGCDGGDPDIALATFPQGALIKTTMNSKVGVLLDEIPASMRDRVATSLIAKPATFWKERAHNQIRLTTYRLVFRQYFYANSTGSKKQLPLPPKENQVITLLGTPRRANVDGHDYVLIDYRLDSVLLTTATSPDDAEPKLKKVGGIWQEPFVLPVDPELVFQRTGFACVDEEDFPPNSVDSEEMDSFYDQDCGIETKLSSVGQCHLTELPSKTCLQALNDSIGKVTTTVDFERIAWDANVAAANRVGGDQITNWNGADLKLIEEEFHSHRIVYRYIPQTSCTLVEGCVGDSGWRRLLQFSTSDKNLGTKTLNIGAVNYYLSGNNGYLDDWGLFEFSACHQHYHFTHYGDFHYGPEIERKNGFCLQSTERVLNHEYAPLTNAYGGCDYQGVEAGWADQYKAGLECQWVDVTTVDTSHGAITYPLSFKSNPDGLLCEGTPILDNMGKPMFELTSFVTQTGQPVYKPACTLLEGWDANNSDSYDVTMTPPGEGFVTEACDRGQVGPLRNCGFSKPAANIDCTPGQTTTARCTLKSNSKPQVARLCDYSRKLGTGTACTFQDAVANKTVESGSVDVTFTCPAARDATETGGRVTLYTAPVYPDDAAAQVTCAKL